MDSSVGQSFIFTIYSVTDVYINLKRFLFPDQFPKHNANTCSDLEIKYTVTKANLDSEVEGILEAGLSLLVILLQHRHSRVPVVPHTRRLEGEQ